MAVSPHTVSSLLSPLLCHPLLGRAYVEALAFQDSLWSCLCHLLLGFKEDIRAEAFVKQ